jgi:hypothetical protein
MLQIFDRIQARFADNAIHFPGPFTAPMLRKFFVLISLLSLVMSVPAQEERTKSPTYLEAQSTLLQIRQQQRRDMLREALRLQRVETPAPVRQMTAQEKAELREQLRQQRQDLVKKENQ